ncbi:MAG: T9SS type A sorting domain-containing protein [Saprospiraceae bacterium]|nr:T9SS type A sorting domain-containing protein [Saprospiraceae bacterium]
MLLVQNIPNPFTTETKISFSIPEGATTAEIQILNSNGQMLESIDIEGHGPGEVMVRALDLPAGTYIYLGFHMTRHLLSTY